METPIETMQLEAQNGYTLRLEMHPDCLQTPDDFDCYTPKQIEAWRADSWFYVTLRAVASVGETDLGESWLGGFEAGNFPDTDANDNLIRNVWIWLSDIKKDNSLSVSGLISEAIENANQTVAKIINATQTN